MYLLFDANIWISQFGLNTSLGSAIRFYAKQHGAILVIPEVVRLEVERGLSKQLRDATGVMRMRHRSLLSVFGHLKELVLPSDPEIDAKVSEILTQIDMETRLLPFTIEVAKSSLTKVIEKMPPADRTEEFRDGVIWAHCVELLAEADVFLVTKDKAFFEGHDFSKGLAKSLEREASQCPHELRLFSDLSDLLQDIRRAVQIDHAVLAEVFLSHRAQAINAMLEQLGYAIESPSAVTSKLFATESSSILHVEFEVAFRCIDTTAEGRADARLLGSGNCLYDSDSEEIREVQSRGEVFEYTDEHGEQRKQHHVLAAGNINIGHADVHHTVRVPLD